MPLWTNCVNYFDDAAALTSVSIRSGAACTDRLHAQKKSRRAGSLPARAAAFAKRQMTLSALRLWLLDEFGIHLAMSRANARAPRGECAVVVEPFETGGNISVIGALTLDGVRAPMMIEGAIDGQVLELYSRHFLAPQLRPGDIVIWDNVPTHKSANVLALIEATGRGWNHCPPTRPTSIRRKDAFPRSKRN